MVTDYDCWHEAADDVEVADVIGVLRQNAELAQDVVRRAVEAIDPQVPSPWAGSLRQAIISDPATIPAATRLKLAPLVGPYLDPELEP